MMNIRINDADQPELSANLSGRPLGEALRELGRILDGEGLLMTHLEVDGENLTGVDRSELDRRQDVARLTVEAHRPAVLIGRTLDISREWLPPLKRELTACAERFRSGEDSVAIESLLQVIEGLRLLLTGAAQIVRLAELRLPDLPLDGLQGFQQQMSEHLDELIEAQEGQDWILLADLLEYDVRERLDRWQEAVRELDLALAGGDGTA
jgi:HPt (histidine-containing phosphotransfer) domain-containing protein